VAYFFVKFVGDFKNASLIPESNHMQMQITNSIMCVPIGAGPHHICQAFLYLPIASEQHPNPSLDSWKIILCCTLWHFIWMGNVITVFLANVANLWDLFFDPPQDSYTAACFSHLVVPTPEKASTQVLEHQHPTTLE
jgi:hypothetical protein